MRDVEILELIDSMPEHKLEMALELIEERLLAIAANGFEEYAKMAESAFCGR